MSLGSLDGTTTGSSPAREKSSSSRVQRSSLSRRRPRTSRAASQTSRASPSTAASLTTGDSPGGALPAQPRALAHPGGPAPPRRRPPRAPPAAGGRLLGVALADDERVVAAGRGEPSRRAPVDRLDVVARDVRPRAGDV